MTISENNISLIKEALHSIAKQITSAPKAKLSNELKSSAAKLYNILSQNNNPIERFYFIYSVCQLCGTEKSSKVDKLMKILLPSQQNPGSNSLISDLISFAICHPSIYSSILDNTSAFVGQIDSVHIDIESWYQAESLAIDSPTFCSELLSRPDLFEMGIEFKLLAKWLHDLSKTNQTFTPINLSEIIRELLTPSIREPIIHSEQYRFSCSDLHFGILTLIQSKKCQPLSNQFLVELSKSLSNPSNRKGDEATHTSRIDCFAQILSVAIASKVASMTNTLRSGLEPLRSNHLISTIIKWPNK